MSGWKQERPEWCPHQDCIFKRRAMDSMCGGELPEPILHDENPNTHRMCLRESDPPYGIGDYQVDANDLDWFRWIFDALDGKATSWLSNRKGKS